jgi:hypothetical protein
MKSYFRVVSRFELAPLHQGASLWEVGPGLKPSGLMGDSPFGRRGRPSETDAKQMQPRSRRGKAGRITYF